MVHRLAGIAPPSIRRDIAARKEKSKQLSDCRHPLHNHTAVTPRLPSRKSFATTSELSMNEAPSNARTNAWKRQYPNYSSYTSAVQPPVESLPPGHNLPRRDWCALNRARTGVGRTGDNMVKWGFSDQAMCPCGAEVQFMTHCLRECALSTHCNNYDLQRGGAQGCQMESTL